MSFPVSFINYGPGDSQDSAERRRNVHVEAMRQYRRKQRLSRMKEHRQEDDKTERTTEADIDSTGSPKVGNEVAARDDWIATTISRLALDELDPFMSSAIDLQGGLQSLADHFMRCVGPAVMPVVSKKPEITWHSHFLREAISSPLLLAAVCTHASTHLDFVRGQRPSYTTLQLRECTLQRLNSEIQAETPAPTLYALGATSMLFANAVRVMNLSDTREGLPII